ncbi:MAG: hypothetical protein VKJ24_01705, partial [Synechococcales bacterium]|nr:hypothetical protein [Synechococcales bacterium]
MNEKIDRTIAIANNRLKHAKLGITIQRIGNGLFLRATLPRIRIEGRTHEQLGRAVSKFFAREIPFECYALRYCWAVRTILFGLDPSLAARQMGHSVEVHQRVYHRWLAEKIQERNHHALKASP